MKELTIERAYELAVKKWQYIVDNNGKEPDEYPYELKIIKLLLFECSYCEMFFDIEPKCEGCPLKIFEKNPEYYSSNCRNDKHPYEIWTKNETKENAQAVLDLIIKTKP